jgi:hypothetical protein
VKYSTEITIDLPRERVVELFDNPDNLQKWQQGLVEFDPLDEEPDQPGAKTRLVYEENGRQVEMLETIVRRNLPDEFTATYEAKGVWNLVENRFVAEDDKTHWVMENEFKFRGLMMTLTGLFMRRAFPKQTLRDMNRFKTFAESA